ncbi:MAG TPA: SHOCT domain-containing protein [Acidimicrobiales bacterium]|nr:SHOCT domain-containing protein [Acidimicrobiales bacterium]
MGYGWNGGGWGWGAWVFMAVMMVLFWGAIITGAIMIVRYSRDRHGPQPPIARDDHDPAMRVLDERFARGEIDADEYTRRRDLLRTR